MTVGLSSTNFANKVLDHMLRATASTAPAANYVKLHTADPGASAATAASANTTRVAVTFSASTSEPTTLTVIDSNYLTPCGGLLVYDIPLGDSLEWDVSAGMGVRLTAPATVNARVGVIFERV